MRYTYRCEQCGLTGERRHETEWGAEQERRLHRRIRHDGMAPDGDGILRHPGASDEVGRWLFALVAGLLLALLGGIAAAGRRVGAWWESSPRVREVRARRGWRIAVITMRVLLVAWFGLLLVSPEWAAYPLLLVVWPIDWLLRLLW